MTRAIADSPGGARHRRPASQQRTADAAALALSDPSNAATTDSVDESDDEQLERPPADEDLPVDASNDIDRTPTDKSGDETQRNEQSSTEQGVEHFSSRRRRHPDSTPRLGDKGPGSDRT